MMRMLICWPITTFRAKACELLRRGAMITAAAMAIPAVAHTQISCTPSSVMPLPPPIILPVTTTGHGQLTVFEPTFSPAPGNCPGFNATNFGIVYEASQRDKGQRVAIFATFVEELSFPVPNSPKVAFFTAADGEVNFLDPFTLLNVRISTFNALPTGAAIATVNTGPVTSGSSFSGAVASAGTAQLLVDSGNLQLTVEIDLFQGDASGGIFIINFPGSLTAAALPSGSVFQNVLKVDYFSNANTPGAPDATLRIDNPDLLNGNACAHIFVFDADQQLSECCGCVETPDGLRTLSVNKDLTSNPLTGVKSTNGVIEIVGSPGDRPCESISFNFGKVLISWMAQPQNNGKGGYQMIETAFSTSTLGATELAALQFQCAFIQILGGGHGICTCGTGD